MRALSIDLDSSRRFAFCRLVRKTQGKTQDNLRSDCAETIGSIFAKDTPMPIAFADLVDEVMRSLPTTIRVFLHFRMGCFGCPIACFHTIDDACTAHGIDYDAFMRALHELAERERRASKC